MLSKKEKLKEFHRSNIIDVAKKLFNEKGLTQTTMDDIAKEGEYSKTTLYAYFKSKDEIYLNIVCESMLLFKELLVNATTTNENLEIAFMAICEAHVSLYNEYLPDYRGPIGSTSKLMTASQQDELPPIYREVFELGIEIHKVITDFLDERVKRKQVKSDIDISQTAYVLQSGLYGLIIMPNYQLPYADYMNVSRQEFLNYGFKMLLNAIKI